MVRIFGNVKPEDDYPHPLGPEPNFNESVYFNFFDRDRQRGGFLRIGNRANEGYAEVTVLAFEPNGSAYFNYKRPAIDSNACWNAGGLEVQVLDPGKKLRTIYSGSAVFLADPRTMGDPKRAFKENPFRRLEIDLTHTGVGPIYGHVGSAKDADEFARAHYEQHMRVEGELRIEGSSPIQISGHGLRDHSWGPRYWQSTPSYRWITANFGDDLGMVLSWIGGKPGGVFHRGENLVRVTGLELETDYEAGTRFHKSLRANIQLEDGSRTRLTGLVRGFIPLRNRRAGAETHIGEGMTEYRLEDGRVGYGLSEYLDQPPASEVLPS